MNDKESLEEFLKKFQSSVNAEENHKRRWKNISTFIFALVMITLVLIIYFNNPIELKSILIEASALTLVFLFSKLYIRIINKANDKHIKALHREIIEFIIARDRQLSEIENRIKKRLEELDNEENSFVKDKSEFYKKRNKQDRIISKMLIAVMRTLAKSGFGGEGVKNELEISEILRKYLSDRSRELGDTDDTGPMKEKGGDKNEAK